jgi:hypothetical protein
VSETRSDVGPPVRVTLPDGQEVTARLAERRRRTDGSWWYIVHLSLWSEVELQRVWTAAPYDVVMAVPVKKCAPVEGQDYNNVPTVRDRA